MFKKVLIAEDEEFLSIALRVTLENLDITLDNHDYVTYCDYALMRIKKALQGGNPYELLITDLSFLEDQHKQEISSGTALIRAVKEIQPDISVLVFSVDHRKSTANSLFSDLGIDGYVPKGRGAAKDFNAAINAIYNGKKYSSPNLQQQTIHKNERKLTQAEKVIVNMIAEGETQKSISSYLKDHQIKPSSLSNIEKTLSRLKIEFNVSTPAQLICYCRDKEIL